MKTSKNCSKTQKTFQFWTKRANFLMLFAEKIKQKAIWMTFRFLKMSSKDNSSKTSFFFFPNFWFCFCSTQLDADETVFKTSFRKVSWRRRRWRQWRRRALLLRNQLKPTCIFFTAGHSSVEAKPPKRKISHSRAKTKRTKQMKKWMINSFPGCDPSSVESDSFWISWFFGAKLFPWK